MLRCGNANGKLIDIWLIYRCVKCKTVWNMTIFERKNRTAISTKEYEGFLSNSLELAKKYGTDGKVLAWNKAELIMDGMEYEVLVTGIKENDKAEEEIEFVIPSFMELRIDTLLAKQMEVSRSYIQTCCKEGLIYESGKKNENKNIAKSKVRTGMVICSRLR